MSWPSKDGEERKLKLAATDPAACSGPGADLGAGALPPAVPRWNRWLPVVVCVFLALAVWAVFGQTIHYEFVNYDDNLYVYGDPHVIRGLSWQEVAWAFTHVSQEPFPVTQISHMLDWQWYGLHAGGHHLTNVLLHAATAILLFLALRKMTGALWPAAFVAAVFAIHPLRVESVAWVTERKDVLSGLFFMLTLWAYGCYAEKGRRQKVEGSQESGERRVTYCVLRAMSSGYYWLALLFFALGLLSKSMLVTLPFVLLLLDYWPLGRVRSAECGVRNSGCGTGIQRVDFFWLAVEKIPFLLLAVADGVLTLVAANSKVQDAQVLSFAWRIGNALLAYVDYLGHMIYPVGLALVYPQPGKDLPFWRVGMSVLVLLLVSAGAVAGRRKHPYLLVGWLWYLGMLAPVIDVMQVGDQAREDRYTYLPQIGLYILVAWGAAELCGSWRHRRVALGAAAAAMLAGLAVCAHAQTKYWKDSISLWTHTLACAPESLSAHNNLGVALVGQGRWDEARELYERALQLNPDDADAHVNLGAALEKQGQWAEAMLHYERALQLKPDLADAHNNLGFALARQGKLAEAIPHFERALQLNPDFVDAHVDYGMTLAAQGRLNKAIQQYEQALQLKPDCIEAEGNLGNVLAAEGKLDEARAHFQQALNLATVRNDAALADALSARLKSMPPALPQPQTH